ncbi:hypothetical protein [Archangium violaceum]
MNTQKKLVLKVETLRILTSQQPPAQAGEKAAASFTRPPTW